MRWNNASASTCWATPVQGLSCGLVSTTSHRMLKGYRSLIPAHNRSVLGEHLRCCAIGDSICVSFPSTLIECRAAAFTVQSQKSERRRQMITTRALAIGAGIVCLTVGLHGQGVSQYRHFSLRADVASVGKVAGIEPSDTKTFHQ